MRRSIANLIIGITILLFGVWQPSNVFAQVLTPTPTAVQFATANSTIAVQVSPALGLISQPQDGSNLHGSVAVRGSADGAWVLSFSYMQSTVQTWFQLAQASSALQNGTFATWDTSNLTDGLYNLKLSVSTATGSQDIVVNVRVNNYSFVEIETPTPTFTPTITLTPTFTVTTTSTLQHTRTATPSQSATAISTQAAANALPDTENSSETPVPDISQTPLAKSIVGSNPAVLAPTDIIINFGKGVLAVFGIFLLAGFIIYLRRK